MVTRLVGDRAEQAGRGLREAEGRSWARETARAVVAERLAGLEAQAQAIRATLEDTSATVARLRWRTALAAIRAAEVNSLAAERATRAAWSRYDASSH